MSKHLTDSERLHIVEEYLGSPGSKYAIEKKYNIAQGLIKHWLRKFGPEDKILAEQTMKASPHPKSDLTPGEKEELERLRKEVRLLKAKLKRESLGHEADILHTSIVLYCQYLRRRENLPKAGFRELFVLCKQYFGEKFSIARDRFCRLLRANDLSPDGRLQPLHRGPLPASDLGGGRLLKCPASSF